MFSLIKSSFGLSASILFKKISNISKKIVRLNCRNAFLKKCKTLNVIPASLRVKALVNSKKGNFVASQSSKKFLSAAVSLNHGILKSLKIALHANIVNFFIYIPVSFLQLIFDFLKRQADTVKFMLTKKLEVKLNSLTSVNTSTYILKVLM